LFVVQTNQGLSGLYHSMELTQDACMIITALLSQLK